MKIELKDETLRLIEQTREINETVDAYVERSVCERASLTHQLGRDLPRPLSMKTGADVQRAIFDEALAIYVDRNVKYQDNWRRFGWRGCLFRLRERVERVWDEWFDKGYSSSASLRESDVDDLLDMINFAAFTIRAIREGNRDGSWFVRP